MNCSGTIVSELEGSPSRMLLSTGGKSLLEHFLTPEVKNLLRYERTDHGTTLEDVVKSGAENPDSKIGIYAPEADAYRTFSLLFDPIIEAYHGTHSKTLLTRQYQSSSETEWRDFSRNASDQIVSIQIRACRSPAGFPLHGKMSRQEYQDVERQILRAVEDAAYRPYVLVGVYHPLDNVSGAANSAAQPYSEQTQVQAPTKGLWPQSILQDKYLCSAGADAHYPTGRGVYINHTQDLALWINEEDHLRVMAVRPGADLRGVLHLFDTTLTYLEHTARLEFAFDDKLGYITFCPSNLGTTIRLSVLIHLPNFKSKPEMLQELANKHNLQIRGVKGEHSSLEDGGDLYDVSNARRLGISEVELINEMVAGVELLVHYT